MQKICKKSLAIDLKLFVIILFVGFFVWNIALAHAATYTIPTSTATVDGTTFCGGKACTSLDSIIIAAGPRGGLLLQNFNGNGSYITIKNERKSPSTPVTITNNYGPGYGVLNLRNCKYVDLRGDNDPALIQTPKSKGIIVNGIGGTAGGGVTAKSGTVIVYGLSEHIKIGYVEANNLNNSTQHGIGIQIQDVALSRTNSITDIEIHNNYIHDTRYSGMYLGHNDPYADDEPYVNNFLIHDNLLEDMGAYGITYKGVSSGTSNIYNNIIRRTGLIRTDLSDVFAQGIGTAYLYGSGTTVNIYKNWIENTKGNGIKVGNSTNTNPTLNIYQNTIVGCGTGNEIDSGHGIGLIWGVSCTVNVNDNIIIQPTRYGLYAGGETSGNCNRNLIGGGLGERIYSGDGLWTEGTGGNANIYHADVATFGFSAWSDDDDYSNDDFTILGNDTTPPAVPTGLVVN